MIASPYLIIVGIWQYESDEIKSTIIYPALQVNQQFSDPEVYKT